MLTQRLVWAGGAIISAITIYLSWAQVADHLAKWSFGLIGGLLLIASMVMFPWGQNEDGSSRRLINSVRLKVAGHNNPTIVAGNRSRNNATNVNARGPATVNFHGLEVTLTELRQLAIDASHAEVLPAARALADDTAVAVIDQRIGVITDKVITRINETDPSLFVRWEDPRFLAALTSAQRSFAETGDESLADLHAKLLVALASQPIRSRREIIVRQAIEVAPQLTTDHVNALAVNTYLGNYKLTEILDTDGLIRSIDTLLTPYYGRLPSSTIDYQYMSSTGVCYVDQLRAFGGGPYQALLRRYPNAMYPAFTFAEMREDFLSDQNENGEENAKLLGVIVDNDDAYERTATGFVFKDQNAIRFRVAPEHADSVLTYDRGVEAKLSEPQQKLREMVRQRSLTEQQFEARVRDLKPELADFLDVFQRTGGLGIQLHPVGFVLAQHEIASQAPQMAALIDNALDDG